MSPTPSTAWSARVRPARPNPRDGRGTLAEITDAGREVVERATRDLLDMEFGLGCYSDEELWEIYTVFRKLRVNYGDFRAES